MANKSEARWKKEGRMAMPAVEPFFCTKIPTLGMGAAAHKRECQQISLRRSSLNLALS